MTKTTKEKYDGPFVGLGIHKLTESVEDDADSFFKLILVLILIIIILLSGLGYILLRGDASEAPEPVVDAIIQVMST